MSALNTGALYALRGASPNSRARETGSAVRVGGPRADVLRRPQLGPYRVSEADIEDVLTLVAPTVPTVERRCRGPRCGRRVRRRAAVAGRTDAIVAGDRDLLDDGALREWLRERGIELLTPAELLRLLA